MALGLLGVVRWVRHGGLKPLALAIFGFIGATFFQGGMIVGLLVFSAIVFWGSIKQLVLRLWNAKLKVSAAAILLAALAPVVAFLLGILSVPKLGDISRVIDSEVLVAITLSSTRSGGYEEGGAVHPAWTFPDSPWEIIYKGPIRALYFMFSQFPRDVKKPAHLIGIFDSALYLVLIFLLWRNRRAVWADLVAGALLIFFAYLAVFGFAVSNIGTALRHRAKFVVI
jgi:hypothetical protein